MSRYLLLRIIAGEQQGFWKVDLPYFTVKLYFYYIIIMAVATVPVPAPEYKD